MKTIEIITSQNVPLQYELAEVKERFFALLIDYIIMVVIMVIIGSLMVTSGTTGEPPVLGIILILSVFLCPLIFEFLMNGQSPGKKALHIRVIKLNGSDLSLSDFLARWFLSLVEIYLTSGCLAALFVNASENSQRLGDMIAGTTVVRISPKLSLNLAALESIKSAEGYTAQYPDAVKFSENDMIILKETLVRHGKYKNQAHRDAVDMLAHKIAHILNLEQPPKDNLKFLSDVLKDYVALTR